MSPVKAAEPIGRIKAAVEDATRSQTSTPEVRRSRAIVLESILLLLALGFTALAILVKLTDTLAVDLRVAHYLQASDAPLFRWVMIAVSWAGNSPQAFILVGLIACCLYATGLHWEALVSLIAAVGVVAINFGLKVAIHRPRPTADLINVVTELRHYSFPSGHVMFYLGYFGFLWYLAFSLLKDSPKRTLALVALGLPIVLVGISRIFLGAHWPSDVLGAYLMGIIVLTGIVHLHRWGKTRYFVHQPVAPALPRT